MNSFSGSIPSHLGLLTNLQSLYLYVYLYIFITFINIYIFIKDVLIRIHLLVQLLHLDC